MHDWIKAHYRLLRAILVGDLVVLIMLAGFLLRQAAGLDLAHTMFGDRSAFANLQATVGAAAGGAVVGEQAPGFTLTALDGDEVTLSAYRGRPLLINFWASWCAPCRAEMPDLVRAYKAHQADGLVVLAINTTAQDSIADVRAFVSEFKLPFPVLLDETDAVARGQYQLRGLPMSVFVDRKGTIVRRHLGTMSSDQIDAFVDEIVNEP